MPGENNNDIPSIIVTTEVGPTLPAASPLQSPSSCLLSPTGFRIAHCPPSPTISDLDVGSIPPSPTLSSHSGTHFHTSIQLRDNHPDQSSSGLTSLGLLSSKTPGHSRRGRNATLDEDIRDSDDDDQPRSVHVFPNAQNLLIQDTAINSAGRDITIIHNNVTYAYHDPEPSRTNLLSQWSNLFSSARSHLFHAAEVIKSILPSGFSTSPAIDLEEKVAEDVLKYPPLNAKILLSKTSMCIPGFVSQTLSSVRYSFF